MADADDAHNIAPPQATLSENNSAEQRLQLTQKLLTSRDPGTQVRLFFQYLAPALPFSGLEYRPADATDASELLGKPGRHQCDYRLHCGEQALGHFFFSREQPFSEAERRWLEDWLSVLTPPLSNALQFQDALRLSMVDALTGVGNRAALDASLHRELSLAEREQTELSLLLVDVDHFKRVNDQFGHSHGDEVLRQVAQRMSQLCRSSDLLFRYGGEEFVMLLRKTDRAGARVIADRVREGVEEQVCAGRGKKCQPITVSIGIGTRLPEGEVSIHSLFDRADRALYRAKEEGRNRVIGECQGD